MSHSPASSQHDRPCCTPLLPCHDGVGDAGSKSLAVQEATQDVPPGQVGGGAAFLPALAVELSSRMGHQHTAADDEH